MNVDIILEVSEKLEEIGNKYAKHFDEWLRIDKGCTIHNYTKLFSFSLNYPTPGIGKSCSLPLSLVELTKEELEAELERLAEEQKKKEEEERKRNTCETCGHVKNNWFGGVYW